MMSFKDYLVAQEGVLLPDRAAASTLSKINSFPTTNAHRTRLVPKVVKAPLPVKPFKPTVRAVVPPSMVKKL